MDGRTIYFGVNDLCFYCSTCRLKWTAGLHQLDKGICKYKTQPISWIGVLYILLPKDPEEHIYFIQPFWKFWTWLQLLFARRALKAISCHDIQGEPAYDQHRITTQHDSSVRATCWFSRNQPDVCRGTPLFCAEWAPIRESGSSSTKRRLIESTIYLMIESAEWTTPWHLRSQIRFH
jgi:hypothetical protein